MKLTVIGTGYVGLVTGACLAEVGHHVMCLDKDQDKIDTLNEGGIPIYEPGLEHKVSTNKDAGRLEFTTDPSRAIDHGEIIFIAVGTPPDEDGSADLSAVLAVSKSIGEHMASPKIVVTKSTVPVGSAEKVRQAVSASLKERGANIEFDVASNPEFLREGRAVEDCMKPDRIVIGIARQETADKMNEVYAPFMRSRNRIIEMDIASAELTKYAANAMLATKISFMNEMANIAERVGADIENVRLGIGSDSRIGYSFIYPGAGYGGSCFPKDVKALAATAREHDYHARLAESVDAVNAAQKTSLIDKALIFFEGDLSGKTFALWGLSFKPGTDDMRDAPAREIMEKLWENGAKVQAFDPEAQEECARIYGDRDDLVLVEDQYQALENADGLFLVTEWKTFASLDTDLLKEKLNTAVIFDGRNLYNPEAIEKSGIAYYGIGRGRSIGQGFTLRLAQIG